MFSEKKELEEEIKVTLGFRVPIKLFMKYKALPELERKWIIEQLTKCLEKLLSEAGGSKE